MATKERFRSAYSERVRKTIPSGTGYEDEWEYKINKYGQKVLEKVGETNVYAQIQAHKDDCNIENILKRVAIGDMSDFRPDGVYMDCTVMPATMLEARQAMMDLENTWNKLPNELKAKYNYSLDEYISASGTTEWLKDMGMLPTEEPNTSEPIEETKVEEGGTDE